MNVRVFAVVLGLVLLASPAPASAAGQHKWGKVLDSYGAKLYACRTPKHTKLGTQWQIKLRAVNNGRVRVRVSVRVIRTLADNHQVTKQTWARDVARGRSTRVGSIPVYDQHARTSFYENVTFRIGRPHDALVLQWEDLVPTGVPRCSLPPQAIAWQGSGFAFDHGGRMQLCSNLFLDAGGARMFWRLRGDATHADQALLYNYAILDADGERVRGGSTGTYPGGYTHPRSVFQAVTPTGGGQLEQFRFGASADSGDDYVGSAAFRNVC